MPQLALTTSVRDEAPCVHPRRGASEGDKPSSQRIGAFDGLRGLAVALVVAYHLPLTVSVVPGGTLGVDVFFVLSGFLVTSLLLRRTTSGGGRGGAWAELRGFWFRRVVRLGPALLVLLMAWSLLWALTGGGGVFNTSVGHPAGAPSVPTWVDLRGLLAVALYAYNWLAATGAPLPLAFAHLWSLSVEEQFYLVWPVVVLLMLRRARPPTMLGVTAALIVLSAVVTALQSPAHAYAWSYYGTESRAQQLLLGALLAMCWAQGLLRLSRRLATAAGLAGLAALGLASRNLDEHGWLAAHGGMLLTAVAAAAIVLCVLCQGGGPAIWLRWRPLRWLGRRSYAIYLWSFPLTMWSAGLSPGVQAVAVIALALTLAEVSWRFVEEPAQRWLRVRAARADRNGELGRTRRRGPACSANPPAE